jgi:hypothetical protein
MPKEPRSKRTKHRASHSQEAAQLSGSWWNKIKSWIRYRLMDSFLQRLKTSTTRVANMDCCRPRWFGQQYWLFLEDPLRNHYSLKYTRKQIYCSLASAYRKIGTGTLYSHLFLEHRKSLGWYSLMRMLQASTIELLPGGNEISSRGCCVVWMGGEGRKQEPWHQRATEAVR